VEREVAGMSGTPIGGDPERVGDGERQAMRDALARRLAALRGEGIRRVKLAITDVDGVLRGKYLALDKLEALVDGTAGFCDCVLGWDVDDVLYDNVAFTGWHTGFPDARYRLDPATERRLPGEDTPFLLAEFVEDEGARRHPICPRSRLKAVLARAAAAGFTVRTGLEYEFFVFRETPADLRAKDYRGLEPLTPGNFGYSILRASTEAPLFTGLMDHADALETPLEGLHCETGPGVWEAALQAADGIEGADRANLFKTFTKVFFEQRAMTATFMARWSMDHPGQSGHLHVSLLDGDGRNVFHDPEAPDRMSATQRHFVGGLQRHMRELCALYAPTVNSYVRLVPGYWAPTSATWGVENRTCALRVLGGSAKSQRVEFRAAGADANPYLATAAVLAAGLEGIEQGIEPGEPVSGNAYALQADLPEALRLPGTLREAAGLLRGSAVARRWLGDAFVDHFAATREWEAREHERQVDDWQLRRYFEVI
jgi:glutamine synthetase